MKRLVLISAIFTGSACFAQNQCNSDNPLFNFNGANTGTPKEIRKLGSSPEFPFLRNMTSAKQFTAALHRNAKNNTAGMHKLNDMLMGIGFANGARDVDESNVSMYNMPSGTEGNMGSANYSTTYCKLNGPNDFKSWKISSNTGCYMYIMAKCGNAFYPKSQGRTASCIQVPVNVTGDMTLNSTGQTATTTDKLYIYYAKKHHHRRQVAHANADIPDAFPSTPLLLSTTTDVQDVPQTYKLTLNTPDNTVTVCPDSTLNLSANINVEKTSEYSGYYPTAKKEYKKVSKRVYRKTERKMHKARRKERKVARATGESITETVVSNK